MAGRYILTPKRRAALKRAQAKSAAKRKGRGQYRAANKVAANKINAAYYRNPSRQNLKKGRAAYDRAKNNNAVKYKGGKKRSDRYLKNKRRAVTTAVNGAALAVSLAPSVIEYRKQRDNIVRERTGGTHTYKSAKAHNKKVKQHQKSVAKNRKATIGRHMTQRSSNFKAAGLDKNGNLAGKRSGVKGRRTTHVSSVRGSQLALTSKKHYATKGPRKSGRR